MKGKLEHFELKGRACACFVPENGAQHLAVLCGWHMEEMLCALAEEAPRTLLFFAEADGGRDFTPWAAEPVWENEPFLGGGAEYLRFLTETALPYLEERYTLPPVPARRAILGYSLGGLFALWALCETKVFGQAASISGSMWYPGFSEYIREHLPRKNQRVYLSLGDRESFGGPPALRAVGEKTEKIRELLEAQEREVFFEWNHGGHAKGVENRWRKALRWTAAGFEREEGK